VSHQAQIIFGFSDSIMVIFVERTISVILVLSEGIV